MYILYVYILYYNIELVVIFVFTDMGDGEHPINERNVSYSGI